MSEEIQTSYSGVTLSQGELDSIVQNSPSETAQDLGEQQAQEQESQEIDQSESSVTEESEDSQEIYDLEVNGETYDMETIQNALDAFQNKAEWQKSNTEKAQTISAERKAIDAERKIWSDLKGNEDAMDVLRDVLDDDHPIFNSPEVDKAQENTSQDTEDLSRVEELEERLNEFEREKEEHALQVEADQQVNVDLGKLKQSHPELEDPNLLNTVIETAINKGFTGYDGLEDAFVLAHHQAAENSAFKVATNRAISAKAAKSIPETKGRVKGQHTEPITKSNTYKDARVESLKNYNFYE